jgi:hypothetical protein
VLEIGRCRRDRTEGGRIEGAAAGRDQREQDAAADGLEAQAADVSVRDPVGGEVQGRTEQERLQARVRNRTDGTTDRDV